MSQERGFGGLRVEVSGPALASRSVSAEASLESSSCKI